MGTYVEFRPCGVTGVIGQLLTEIDGYARWYASDFAEDGTREVLDLVHMLRERGAYGLESVPPELHWAIDRMVTEFYGVYCDDSERCPALPPRLACDVLRVQRYREMQDYLAEHAAKTVTSLWAYIGSGRPIAPANRVTGFVSCDEATWVSWWAPDEVETLLRDLPGPSFATSDFTEGVLASVHCALNHAASNGSGLVITAF